MDTSQVVQQTGLLPAYLWPNAQKRAPSTCDRQSQSVKKLSSIVQAPQRPCYRVLLALGFSALSWTMFKGWTPNLPMQLSAMATSASVSGQGSNRQGHLHLYCMLLQVCLPAWFSCNLHLRTICHSIVIIIVLRLLSLFLLLSTCFTLNVLEIDSSCLVAYCCCLLH